jgi:hypothetical protein
MEELGAHAGRDEVVAALARQFAKHFEFELLSHNNTARNACATTMETIS